MRVKIISPPVGSHLGPYPRVAPPKSLAHIGKKGTAEEDGGGVKITLDDGTVLYGWECWWEKVEESGGAK